MKKELDDKLCKDFPRVFRQRNGDMMSTAMCWGFECGDGWFDLLYKCAARIEREIVRLKKEDPTTPDEELPCASQVKEKYGTLRFYMSWNETPEIEAAISEAEDESEVTCENCGKPGEVRGGGWLYCACEACEDERQNPKPKFSVEDQDV